MSNKVSPETANRIESLRGLIEVESEVRHWGQEHLITPRLVSRVFGDGKHLIWFAPLNTRPNYYVLMVDSQWDEYSEDQIYDLIGAEDGIVDAIIEEYSDVERQRKYIIEDLVEAGVSQEEAESRCNTDEFESELDWPVYNGNCGHCWGDEDYPVVE